MYKPKRSGQMSVTRISSHRRMYIMYHVYHVLFYLFYINVTDTYCSVISHVFKAVCFVCLFVHDTFIDLMIQTNLFHRHNANLDPNA